MPRGERVIADTLIRDGILTVISYVPSGSLCGVGGNSWVTALDACSGGRLSLAHFDINADSLIDNSDLVAGLPPSSIRYEGRLQPPAILILDGQREKLYMSSSKAQIETLMEKAPRLGIIYWRVKRQ